MCQIIYYSSINKQNVINIVVLIYLTMEMLNPHYCSLKRTSNTAKMGVKVCF